MKRFALLAAVPALLFAAAASAHTDEYLATVKSPNGGQLRMAGPFHFELVVAKDSKEVKENAIVVYVTDHADKKIDTKGMSGTATILAGKLKATATLTPDGDNRLKGFAKYASDAGMKVAVTVKMADGKSEQARFVPLAPAKAAAGNDDHAGHKH